MQIATGSAPAVVRREDFRRWVCTLLAVVVCLLMAVEFVVRTRLERSSQIEGRIVSERRAVLAMGSQPGQKMLVIGNSLVLMGVDFPVLQQALAPNIVTVRYVVEQTGYLDWFYALRRLYSEGVRPDIVVLSLNARQMTSNTIRGEYFAYRMMKTGDFLVAGRDAHLSATGTLSLLLGNLSAFYGTRAETRKFIMFKVIPSVELLVPFITPASEPDSPDYSYMRSVAGFRLKEMNELVRKYGGRLIFVVPAAFDPDPQGILHDAALEARVTSLIPLSERDVTPADFSDGFHLNPSGASRYTAALVADLGRVLQMADGYQP